VICLRIGYACIALAVQNADLRSCTLKNAFQERLLALAAQNLAALEHIVDYNIKNKILLYRISSDLIPFGSSAAAFLPWEAENAERFAAIGAKIARSGMRVSMHPGQYTVLNSPDADVVRRSLDALAYHARVLDALGLGPEHKLVLHAGGKYGDAKSAMSRFCARFGELDEAVKRRLVLENDGTIYTIAEVLELCARTGLPAVYDNLHNTLNPADPAKTDAFWIQQCAPTWNPGDGPQKIHYSQQHPQKTRGAHSATIQIDPFLSFVRALPYEALDIMLEVKDKNLSALKCSLCTKKAPPAALQAEWARYKYAVLERSPAAAANLRALLRGTGRADPVVFYRMIERALKTPEHTGRAVNALEHAWGYFKKTAPPAEQKRFFSLLRRYRDGGASLFQVKNYLYRLAQKYAADYLLDSYYFVLGVRNAP